MYSPDSIREGASRALGMIEQGARSREVLTYLATVAESVVRPASAVSILVLDHQGLLRNGASPNLPADYLDAIDRLRPDANVGTCASAAATGNVVITADFTADDKWAELRHLPMALGFRGAWSNPIKDEDGRVLGTFGVYYREPAEPSAEEREAVGALAAVAARALAKGAQL